jgi:hypothetical protein
MKSLLTGAAMLAVLVPSAFAQTPTSQNQPGAQANANSNKNLTNAQKIQHDLQNAGFKDVQIVAESFVVQAKSKEGDPVVMTIGPHGMSVFEAMNTSNSGSHTTGLQQFQHLELWQRRWLAEIVENPCT